jgi:MOSC domain-containing protein YiiM
MSGTLIGMARRAKKRAPMELLQHGHVSLEAGLVGDSRGAKFIKRQITIMAREDWEAALFDLEAEHDHSELPWTVRRANLLVEGIRLPRAKGALLRIGGVLLEVTGQTNPCHRMEEAQPGLLSALNPDWRGGVTCRVREGADISLGDAVAIVHAPKEHVIRLPA